LKDPQKKQVQKWIAIMGGEKGTKTFPTCLKPFVVVDASEHQEAGAKAQADGVKPYKHERTPGGAAHYFWKMGYDAKKKS